MNDIQSWLPALVTFASCVGVIVTLRVQQKHNDARLSKIERALEHITPRAARVEGLQEQLHLQGIGLAKCREILIQHGWLVPESAPYPRAKTPLPVMGGGDDD